MTDIATPIANEESDSATTKRDSICDQSQVEPEGTEVYEYRDVSGDLRFEKVQKKQDTADGEKSIHLRVPDVGEGMHGRDYVPYRLPEFPNPSRGDSPLMTYHESERAADAVRELGLPATTMPLGPEMSVPRDVVPHFGDLQVVIVPDNDEEGRYHTGRVGEALQEVATCVKVAQLDGREEGGDVADWIEQKRSEDLSSGEIKRAIEREIGNASASEPGDFRAGEFGLGGPFWYVEPDSGETKVNRTDLVDFLADRGFQKLYADSDESMLVYVEDNVVRPTSKERIKDHVTTYLKEEVPGERGVEETLMRGSNYYFSSGLFEFLPKLTADFHCSSSGKAYRYYQNGFVEITERGYDLRPYSELEGLVWKGQIIDRPFVDLSGSKNRASWEWRRCLGNVAGQSEDRIQSLRTSLGYLQHRYKDPALTKVVIFMDEVDSEFADGRTGKSLVAKSLQYTSSAKRMDGRNFRFNRFAFQGVDLGTDIIDYNDARKDFPMSRLFSVSTDDMTVECKGQDSITIRFEDSPKFLISTNFVIEGGGASFDDRAFEVEFADHYSLDHRPLDDFGHRLFEEWDEQEWARFDNTMVSCIQEYLRDGLVEYERENVEYRRLKQNTCASFATWALDTIAEGKVFEKDALYQSFRGEHEPDFEDLKKSTFGKWLGYYARTYNFEKVPSRPSRDGERVRCVKFVPNG